MFSHQGLCVLERLLQSRNGSRVCGIPQCNRHIAQITAPLDTLKRAVLELAPELLRRELQFAYQFRGGHVRAGCEGCIALRGREAIPWADNLTDITSEDPIPHEGAQREGNLPFEFNGQVRNTAPRIERSVGENAVSWAGLQAAGARTARIAGERWIGLDFESQ